jgi:hypothetical protein
VSSLTKKTLKKIFGILPRIGRFKILRNIIFKEKKYLIYPNFFFKIIFAKAAILRGIVIDKKERIIEFDKEIKKMKMDKFLISFFSINL